MAGTTGAVHIERLTSQNWRVFKAIRMEALRCEPAAYSSTFEETCTRNDESWRQRLENPRCIVLVALSDERPIGLVGSYLGSADGDSSVAVVFGMYVTKDWRRRGVGRLLLTTLLDAVSAHSAIKILRLWVGVGQGPARRLYESIGFQIVGKETQNLQGDGRPYDELVMERPVR